MKMTPKSIRTTSLALLCSLPLMAVAAPAERAGNGSRMAEEQQRGAAERGERAMRRDEEDRFRDREEGLREREKRLDEREARIREREERFREERGDRRGEPGEEGRDEQRDRDRMPPGLADNPQAQERVREAQSQSDRGKSESRGNRPWWQFWGSDDEEDQPEN